MFTADWKHHTGTATYWRRNALGYTEVSRYGRTWHVLHVPADPAQPYTTRTFPTFRAASDYGIGL